MREIIINKNNLNETDITEVVMRVKALIVNSNNEILLGYSHNDYQFPGGHVEEGEEFIDALNREIKEEVGLELNIKDAKPFLLSSGYWKDWPSVGKNRKTEVYYYEIKTDLKPNLDNTNYTENEKEGNFELRYIPLSEVKSVLKENALKYGDKKGIAREMLEVFEIYL